jgi:hypothetical protein
MVYYQDQHLNTEQALRFPNTSSRASSPTLSPYWTS